ncbi:hypothetical protein GCM10023116_36630 [Kistimonas scapharcae]|uniref:DUF11 domain-containing protein n=2 Tax=Kistimonas scapharcae TaxID=1036133 RepID=A0ABP8V749_9GAMM
MLSATVGDTVEVILSYERQGKNGNSKLVVTDQLPEVMEFDTDSPVQRCAEDGRDCEALVSPIPNSKDGYEVTLPNGDIKRATVKAQLTGHKASEKGQIRFFATIKQGFEGQTHFNEAEYFSCRGSGGKSERDRKKGSCVDTQTSNRVPITITGPGVTINGSPYDSAKDRGEPVTIQTASPGGTIEFINYVWNTGTDPQNYTVALLPDTAKSQVPFPAGTEYCLSTTEQCSAFSSHPTLAVQGLDAGKSRKIRLRVKLPDTVNAQEEGYFVLLEASLSSDPSDRKVRDTVLNRLVQITDSSSSVDMTYGRPVQGDASVPGKGPGPESEPVKTLSGQPGKSVTFDALFVNNTGGAIDTYNLQLVSASGASLPEGFTAQFVNTGNQPTANSGSVKAGEHVPLKLVVGLPAAATDGSHDFHVVAVSPVTGAKDRLTVRIAISDDAGLVLEPNGEGQVTPGSFITFAHRLTNNSNNAVDNLSLVLSDSLKSQGWQSVLYRDLDGDGVLSGSDTAINSPVSLAGNKTLHLLVKVFAPANASMGIRNVTTLTVIGEDGQRLTVTDTATVNTTSVVIIKEQAPWDCLAAVPVQFRIDAFPARPGTCVVYRLTARNEGVEAVQNVVIHDAAPNFTEFYPHGGLPKTTGRQVVQPNVSGTLINAQWPEGLQPGDSVSLIFAIQIQ